MSEGLSELPVTWDRTQVKAFSWNKSLLPVQIFRKTFEALLIFSVFLNVPAENDNFDLYSFVLILLAAAPWTVTFGGCLNWKKRSCSSSPKTLGYGRKEGWESEPQYMKSTISEELNWVKAEASDIFYLLLGGATLLWNKVQLNLTSIVQHAASS